MSRPHHRLSALRRSTRSRWPLGAPLGQRTVAASHSASARSGSARGHRVVQSKHRRALRLGTRTVESRISRILSKLGLTRRARLRHVSKQAHGARPRTLRTSATSIRAAAFLVRVAATGSAAPHRASRRGLYSPMPEDLAAIQERVEALRQEINQHNYRYHVLDDPTDLGWRVRRR